jgi:hypothetical protein
MPEPTAAPRADEFYVGYLALPRGHRLLLRYLLPALLWLMTGISALVASQMRDAGRGAWDASDRQVFVGVLDVSPYPVLRHAAHEPARAGVSPASYLLVEAGKLGGRDGLQKYQGQEVQVAGTVLQRDGRAMIELAPGEDAVRPVEGPPAVLAAPSLVGRVTLRGEIVDSKCFLGAMRPGDGKTHRACAQLCIAGGLPPMLVTRDAAGRCDYYVLTTATGDTAGDVVRLFVAEPVEVTGELERLDDFMILRVDAGGIRRL